MSSPAELSAEAAARVGLLDQLRERLAQAEALADGVRDSLRRADAEAIDEAASRLATIALEFKLLHAEYLRLPELETELDSAAVEHARAELETVATRVARSAATGGGLLERLVAMSRGLAGTFQSARGQSYRSSGRHPELTAEGLRLRKQV